jgi:hypothetical protein
MPQPPSLFQTAHNRPARNWQARVLRLLCLLAMGATLGACDRCGDFLPSSQIQIGACHSDPPRQ